MEVKKITVAFGDGIGAEIMEVAMLIMREAGANVSVESVEIGERIHQMGSRTGIVRSSWEVITRNKILLCAPTITPEGKSIYDHEYQSSKQAICEKFALEKIEQVGEDFAGLEIWQGEDFAMFTTSHSASPKLAGKNKADPSAMILASAAMLEYIGEEKTATKIKNALQKTNRKKLGTKEFAETVVENLSY